MHPVEAYLKQLRTFHNSGETSDEISFYPALSTLLNAVGANLEPQVVFVPNVKDRGAGFPDGALFTAEQVADLPKKSIHPHTLLEERKPARGVVEIKGTAEDVRKIAKGKQVRRYWAKYQQVLVTNYRDFVLVIRGDNGKPALAEGYTLAVGGEEFWSETVAHAQNSAKVHGDNLVQFLRRALTHAAPIVTPQDVAAIFAAYARRAKAGITGKQLPALDSIRNALEQALGLTFEGEKGEAFFRSTLVQTLFYGVFSAWVLWARKHLEGDDTTRFDWRTSAHYLRVPILRKLFHEVADPGHLDELAIAETLGWAESALSRVVLDEFFELFKEDAAIQYFYEPFLVEFDPGLRKEMGVWFTPHEIVRYQVARVDAVLRDQLGLADGLADSNVFVLDPCCGTGAYLVEVLDVIARRLAVIVGEALVGVQLKKAARERVFGFEIMPAPFVVSHLQLGLLLQRHGAPLSETKNERVAVYLSNALTGWEPPQGPKQQFIFPELSEERDAAEKVKRDTPILVVIGNPPYNGFAGVSPAEEHGLIDAYKVGLRGWGITKNYLDDLYIRFWRLAERRIAEKTGRGVVSYISNFSYLTDPSSVVMRERLLAGFDAMWIDSLNGDSRESGKRTPTGDPDPSVFSTPHNREGIRVGTAISLLVRKPQRDATPSVQFREFWGERKREALIASIDDEDVASQYQTLHPTKENRYLLRPVNVAAAYTSWPSVAALSAVKPGLGLNENRKQSLWSIERDVLEQRMREYFYADRSLENVHPGLATDAARYNAAAVRERLLSGTGFDSTKLQRFWFKPFDLRWAYIESAAKLWNEGRRELQRVTAIGNEFLLVRARAPKLMDGTAFFYSRHLGDQHVLHKDAYFIPFHILDASKRLGNTKKGKKKSVGAIELDLGMHASESESETPVKSVANLSVAAREYLGALGLAKPETDLEVAGLVWLHALAIGYTPTYLSDNADGIRHDWPRIPLPASAVALKESAMLGRQVARLLDLEVPVPGVTTGTLRAFIGDSGVISRVGGGSLNPETGDFALTAGWGYQSTGGIVMPGRGRAIERDYTAPELSALDVEANELGLTRETMLTLLGGDTFDIYLNGACFWRNVPSRVWQYTIGGFQVLKKWLSYREQELLGRDLALEELTEFMAAVRRVTALLLLSPALDASYVSVALAAYAWPLPTTSMKSPSADPDELGGAVGEAER